MWFLRIVGLPVLVDCIWNNYYYSHIGWHFKAGGLLEDMLFDAGLTVYIVQLYCDTCLFPAHSHLMRQSALRRSVSAFSFVASVWQIYPMRHNSFMLQLWVHRIVLYNPTGWSHCMLFISFCDVREDEWDLATCMMEAADSHALTHGKLRLVPAHDGNRLEGDPQRKWR